jgi:predicted HNH restriction endonuclease
LPENLEFICPNCHSQIHKKEIIKKQKNCIQCNKEINKMLFLFKIRTSWKD